MKKLLKIIPIMLIVLIVSTVIISTPNTKRKENIQKVLKTEAYSYLSKQAKDYIEEVYEETGVVVNTEKNKKENIPYLNPKYIAYLSLSEEEKKEVEEIPQVYAIDFPSEGSNSNLPTSYDLRNVNGKNFVSPVKDQDTLDLCWSFTTAEQLESYLMVKNNQSYSSTSQLFSTRQIDYASSTNGIKDYTNENGTRELAKGGNFLASSLIITNGLGLVSESTLPFSLNKNQRELSEVLNYNNSLYELDKSVLMPTITSTTTATEKNNIIDAIKEHVMENGGAYVGTQGPGYSCSSKNSDGATIIRVDNGCEENAGHAMHIIGWNDDYSYAYCKSNQKHTSDISSCSSSNIVRGTGAWILRNSWGSSYPYVYLAYDSLQDDIYIFSDISAMSERTWDNNYHKKVDPFYIYYNTYDTQAFEKNINTTEKVEKVKFFSFGSNGKFTISITSGTNTYSNIKTVTVPYPGIYTIDLHDQNIILNNSNFQVSIVSNNNVSLIKQSMSVFTSNQESTPQVKNSTKALTLDESTSNYSFRLYSHTKNIPSNQRISYQLINRKGEDVTSYLTVNNNIVSKNDVNSLLEISSSIKTGRYTIRTIYGTASDDTNLVIGEEKATVYFYANDGTNRETAQTVPIYTSFQLKANPYTKTGYTFTSWNTKADGSGDSYANLQRINEIEEDLTLYAQWRANSYKIQYNANGGNGSMSVQQFTYDETQPLLQNTFTHSTYHFVSWNTKADGTGTYYQNGQEVSNLTATSNGTVYLYAQWDRVPDVYYKTHVQDYGWQSYVSNGIMSGTNGQSKRLEAIQIKVLNKAYPGNIEYRTHVEDYGWMSYVKNDAMSGTAHEAKRLEAIQIRLTGELASHYDVYYRVHAQDVGWMNWAKNDEMAGTAGYGRRLEGIEIVIVEKGQNPPSRTNLKTNKAFLQKQVLYTTHVQDYGWQSEVADGAMSGTSHQSKRLEGIKIKLYKPQYTGSIRYKTHVQDIGWQNFVYDGAMSGTSGQSKRLEAIRIELTGNMSSHYDIYYRVHAEHFGWMNWAKNGASAGTAHYGYRLEGIEIVIVDKGERPPTRNDIKTSQSFIDKYS